MSPNYSRESTYSTSVIQINLGKRFTAATTLHKELKTNQICLIQEPVVRKGTIGNVPRSHQQFVPYTQDRPRVAALLPKDLGRKTMVLSGLSSGDNITLRCSINKDLSIILTSIYMDITKDIPSDLITRIASYAERERLPPIASVRGLQRTSHCLGAQQYKHKGQITSTVNQLQQPCYLQYR